MAVTKFFIEVIELKKFCEVCGKEFETNIPNKKYCSVACRKKKDIEYHKLYREVNAENTKFMQAIYNFRARAQAKGLFWAGDC